VSSLPTKIIGLGIVTLALFSGLSIYTAFCPSKADPLQKVGLVENVYLDRVKVDFRAKIDTGANTSSINALDVETFKKDSTHWVSFTIINKEGKRITLTRPVYRFARIRRSGARVDKRPVVLLSMCMGGVYKEAQFSLKNRQGMNYAMLIGRRVLDNNFLVDPAKNDLTKPLCKK